jgi:hypothetical protein
MNRRKQGKRTKANTTTDHAAIGKRVRAVIALAPLAIDEAAIRLLLCNPSPLRTQQEVASVFGQSTNTVAHSWRANGMSGIPGNYDPVAVLVWFLRRNAANSEAQVDELAKRKREAETLAAEADARIKQTKAERVVGEYIPVEIARSILAGLANRVRDAFMELPRKYMATWPAKYAQQFAEDLEADIRRILTMISETPLPTIRRYVEEASDAETED